MWEARTKNDLIIEVWEKLDCESIGEAELVAIETVVREQYGESAVDLPMIVARMLADEGAELRHKELMELHVKRRVDSPYAPMFRNIFNLSSFAKIISSFSRIENLRKKFVTENDKQGLRLIKNFAIELKETLKSESADSRNHEFVRSKKKEIAEWLTIWLQSPEIFEHWVKLRQESSGFKQMFGSEPEQIEEAF